MDSKLTVCVCDCLKYCEIFLETWYFFLPAVVVAVGGLQVVSGAAQHHRGVGRVRVDVGPAAPRVVRVVTP